MDTQVILQTIQNALIIPLILLVGGAIVAFTKEKLADLKAAQQDKKIAKYIDQLANTIEVCVTATNQTYVNELKEKNMFDAAAQKEAFKKTYQAVLKTLTVEAKKYLEMAYADLNGYIEEQIESAVGDYRLQLDK